MGDLVVTAAKVALCHPEKAEVYTGIAGVAITAGQALYFVAATGLLGLADEDLGAESSQVVGIALNGAGVGGAVDYVRRGCVYGFTLSGVNYGVACSLSNTAGALLDTAATTNIVGRVHALSDANLTKVLLVDVSPAAAS
jgi:hypothetical protein